jgi:dextranase
LEAALLDARGQLSGRAFSACDVLEHWSQNPRYGFLSDFSPNREDAATTAAALARFHINALQFYDWQYRHHQLLPPQAQYLDPLGRTLSLASVRSLLQAAHERGMSALAYLAVYAAGLDFWREHPSWALYDELNTPLRFFDFLGLMNPASGSPWAAHLARECARVLQELPFNGLHVDQYGDPKIAYDDHANEVDLPAAFTHFLNELRLAQPSSSLLFNAVGNWPIEAVAPAPTDAVYIEIWPPATRYTDIVKIVQDARRLSGGKAVIIALYQPADQPANILLADAIILACGGSRIELGENARLLADPYFPKHQPLSPSLYRALRRHYSFAARYACLLGPQAHAASELKVDLPPDVLAFPRRSPGWLAIALVNLTGVTDPEWDKPHPAPKPVEQLSVKITGDVSPDAVYWASPENNTPALLPANWRREGGSLHVAIPRVEQMAIIAVKLCPPKA